MKLNRFLSFHKSRNNIYLYNQTTKGICNIYNKYNIDIKNGFLNSNIFNNYNIQCSYTKKISSKKSLYKKSIIKNYYENNINNSMYILLTKNKLK